MGTAAGFPYVEVEFTRDAAVHDPSQVQAAHDLVASGTVTDLIVISHGWNNDMAEARELCRGLLTHLRTVLDRNVVPRSSDRTYGALAVLWPSKKFADEELIPGGAAALGSAVSAAFVNRQIDLLEDALQAPEKRPTLEQARALVPALPNSPRAQEEFADLIRSVLPTTDVDTEDGSGDFFTRDGKDLMDRLSKPTPVSASVQSPGGAAAVSSSARSGASGLAGLVQSFSGALSAARNLLNYSTYYLMKERAGTVGRRGVNSVLRQLKAARPDLRIHLVGHSFGARLVTAAVDGPSGAAPTVFDSLVLLQGAFSHNSFGERFDGVRDGAFRGVITGGKIRGPIVITHSGNDRAVGLAYPLASRVAGQDASGIGDAADRFGALGRNGAQHAPERVEGVLQPVGAAYGFSRSKIYNLKADSIIEDHSDIFHPEVAYAMLSAVVSA